MFYKALGTLSKIALLGSYLIYLARRSQSWNPFSLIEVGEQEVRRGDTSKNFWMYGRGVRQTAAN